MKTKRCSRCGPQPVTAFTRNSSRADGLEHVCQSCRAVRRRSLKYREKDNRRLVKYRKTEAYKRTHTAGMLRWRARPENRLKSMIAARASNLRRYQLTRADYDTMLAKQGGVCAICGKPETMVHKGTRKIGLSVDHEHKTGRVRGLLCSACNRAIGFLRDNPNLCVAAAEYLRGAS